MYILGLESSCDETSAVVVEMGDGKRRILSNILNKFSGGPVGLDTLAAATGEEAGTIEDVYEPYLIQLGFIARTPRGRIALAKAYKHMGLELSSDKEKQLDSIQKGLAETNE